MKMYRAMGAETYLFKTRLGRGRRWPSTSEALQMKRAGEPALSGYCERGGSGAAGGAGTFGGCCRLRSWSSTPPQEAGAPAGAVGGVTPSKIDFGARP